MLGQLAGYTVGHVPRELNKDADRLSNVAIDEPRLIHAEIGAPSLALPAVAARRLQRAEPVTRGRTSRHHFPAASAATAGGTAEDPPEGFGPGAAGYASPRDLLEALLNEASSRTTACPRGCACAAACSSRGQRHSATPGCT